MENVNYINKQNKSRFIFLSLKRNIIPFIFCAFTICLVVFSKSNLSATKSGLTLWVNNVIPSLFPFFIATELLGYTNIIYSLGKIFNPIMKPIFNVPGIGSYPFIMGIISGYPIGAKIVTGLRNDGLCTKEEAERLLAFTNNSGPLFILGTVGISLFGNTLIGILLLITHILACITVGFLFRFWKKNKKTELKSYEKKSNGIKSEVCFSNLGEVLGNSILSATKTIIMIGGFVVLFSVILSILEKTNIIDISANFIYPFFRLLGIENTEFATSFVSGFIELTNGVKQISLISCKQISINIILSAFLLGFGGISIFFQVFSIVAKSDISIKSYLLGKLLHGIIAATYTFLFITFFPIFNLNI